MSASRSLCTILGGFLRNHTGVEALFRGHEHSGRARGGGPRDLGPIADAAAQERVRELILQAYAEYEDAATEAAS